MIESIVKSILNKKDINQLKTFLKQHPPTEESFQLKPEMFIPNFKIPEQLNLYFDYLFEHNVIIDQFITYSLSVPINKKFYDNIDRYEKIFSSINNFVDLILCGKYHNEYSNKILKRYSYNPDTILSYIDNGLYKNKNIDITIYEMFELTLKNCDISKLDNEEFKHSLIVKLLDIEDISSMKQVEDIIKILSSDLIKSYLLNKNSSYNLYYIIYNIKNCKVEYISKDRHPVTKTIELLEKYGIEHNFDKRKIEKDYIDLILYDVYSIYKNDRDNLFKFFEDNKETILKYPQWIDFMELDFILDLYDRDRELMYYFLNSAKNIISNKIGENDIYIRNMINNDEEKLCNIFLDFIVNNSFIISSQAMIFESDLLLNRLFYIDNENTNRIILNRISTDILEDNMNKNMLKYIPYISNSDKFWNSSLYMNRYRKANDILYSKYNSIMNFYHPKDSNLEEIEKVKLSISNIVNILSNLNNDKNKYFMLKKLKNYIENLKEMNIDILNKTEIIINE